MFSPALFSDFFTEVNGRPPFPWQAALAHRVCAEGWPNVVDAPTGTGKTACLDIAVFALAFSASADRELMPRRVVFVVDRRVVVDQAFARARLLADKLQAAAGPAARQIAATLNTLTSTKKPLEAILLRGAVPRDDNWAGTPDQPMIISSTVDQVGSRLLFRGYGVSESMRPIHAGLLGSDCLYLLDEVHLSQPYRETLSSIQKLSRELTAPMPRLQVVALSATPGDTGAQTVHQLGRDDREGPLSRRLKASKPFKLIKCRLPKLPQHVVEEVGQMLGDGLKAVLVTTNRVQRALDCHRALRAALDIEARLLTGRMRPIDRDEVAKELVARCASGRQRSPTDRPLIVVATQSIEAGADFDFDGLVTELAPFDALRQRFGRVDRLGELGAARGVIIGVEEENDGGKWDLSKEDPVYGDRLTACWKLLGKLPAGRRRPGDFGISALDERIRELDDATLVHAASTERPCAPTLFPAYLDLLARTRPSVDPGHVPDVAALLHGPKGSAEVSVVWRADLHTAEAAERIEALPPVSIESLSIPLAAARRWLSGSSGAADFPDAEACESRARADGTEPRWPAWRWTSRGAERLTDVRRLRPGDALLVPDTAGGLFERNFDAGCVEPVRDRAEEATLRARGRAVLRLELRGVAIGTDGELVTPDDVAQEPWLDEMVSRLSRPRDRRSVELEGWTLLVGRSRVDIDPLTNAPTADATTDDEGSWSIGRAVPLARHSRDVEQKARQFCEALRLPNEQTAAVTFAAWLHDTGKADARFQRLLRDGTEASIRLAQRQSPEDWLLAKSGLGLHERAKANLARQRSTYPRGARHEVLSTVLADAASVRDEARRRGVTDFELVLHLIASHHGWCRPFAPVVQDESEDQVRLTHGSLTLGATAATTLHRLEAGLAERFARLTRRYGWHGLARLEAFLRLADHRASEEEARDEEEAA